MILAIKKQLTFGPTYNLILSTNITLSLGSFLSFCDDKYIYMLKWIMGTQ